MEAATEGPHTEPTEQALALERDPRARAARDRAGGDRKREMVEHVMEGASLDAEEEADALDYILGAPVSVPYDMTVQLEGPKGRAPLTFVFKAVDGRKLDEIENRHRNPGTGLLDQIGNDCELVATCTDWIENAAGRKIKLKDQEFLTVQVRNPESGEAEPLVLASPAEALERRFRKQMGLVQGVAREIRRVSGWDAERQGQAQRRLVRASLD